MNANMNAATAVQRIQDMAASSRHWNDYDGGTHVQWICACGSDQFRVFYIEGHYDTYVICTNCGTRVSVHQG